MFNLYINDNEKFYIFYIDKYSIFVLQTKM